MKFLFRLSNWLHKYAGLVLILFLAWMSLTGVLMNHPDLISGLSVPRGLVPEHYHIRDWNRSGLTDVVFSDRDSSIAYGGGRLGVWKSTDGGATFRPLDSGFPESRYYRKTADIFLWEGDGATRLYAGTAHGLYGCDPAGERWEAVPLGAEPEPVRKILHVGDALVVLTESNAFASPLPPAEIRFQAVPIARATDEERVSLVRLFFDLHDGKVWGMPGRLLFDAAGLILFFLSVSAFYSWYYPWKRRREKAAGKRPRSKRVRRLFKWFFKYHLKLGIWTAAILLIIGGTGLFMRPPLLAALVGGDIPAAAYPGPLPDNPWDKKIQNALYDPVSERIVIAATDGLWAGPADFREPFRPLDLDVPIFVMGATVFEPHGEEGYRVGSFNGIYHWQRTKEQSMDMLTGRPAAGVSAVRPGDFMVTGYVETPEGEAFINTHEQGIVPVGTAERAGRFTMPAEAVTGYRMPLWNWLFEIHNGRFFKGWIGPLYILVVPLGSLLFLLITLSGVYDWVYLNLIRKSGRGTKP